MQTTNSCVVSLIDAFASGLEVFKKVRERRRGTRKTRRGRAQTALQEKSGDELRLSRSLRKGPVDIQNEYERHYRVKGERYAVGDCMFSFSSSPAKLTRNQQLLRLRSRRRC